MTAASFIEHSGLNSGGYIIKEAKEFEKDGKKVRLIKLKNPWKKPENSVNKANWVGKFSQKDPFWTSQHLA